LLVLAVACGEDPGPPGAQVRAVPSIGEAGLIAHVGVLAHDSMLGRGSGTADEQRAAQYIAARFGSYGLAGTGLLPFPVPPARVGGQTEVASQNVLGVLPGTGRLQNQWIVVGAHYDHVGARTVLGTTTIFNGADDNASGTAVVLELARTLAAHAATGGFADEDRRSVLFIAFGAEELGLIGSEHYCNLPSYPLSTVTAMLNFDMVGRMRNRTISVGGATTAAGWPALIAAQNTEQLVIQNSDCEACTDHACFRRAGRPVLWFFTGFHAEYHQPGDDVPLINGSGLSDVADLAARIIADLMLRDSF
jgi:hypothetical protein